MGEGTSEISGWGENRPWPVSTEPEPGADQYPAGHDELRTLLTKNIMWMLLGLAVIISGLVGVALIANSGRISSNKGNDLTETGFRTQSRNACITDLRNARDDASGEVADAVLNRLAVLDGYDPRGTGDKTPIKKVMIDGKLVVNPDIQSLLALRYVNEGLKARDKRLALSLKLKQPTLNKLCGDPITDKDDIPN